MMDRDILIEVLAATDTHVAEVCKEWREAAVEARRGSTWAAVVGGVDVHETAGRVIRQRRFVLARRLASRPAWREGFKAAFRGTEERQSEALVRVLAGENVYIGGAGGTGKSFVSKRAIRFLRAFGDVAVLAPTHSAASVIGGKTIASFIGARPTDAGGEARVLTRRE